MKGDVKGQSVGFASTRVKYGTAEDRRQAAELLGGYHTL